VSWDWPAVRIANMIRAVTHPYPGAFVGDGDARLYLWEGMAAEPAAGGVSDSVADRGIAPGTVVDVGPGYVSVATGKGTLRLLRVQGAEGPECPADAWAHARGLRPGDRL
jgi:methionyl-tRNA formyltransferase